jgi:hypothetical protein
VGNRESDVRAPAYIANPSAVSKKLPEHPKGKLAAKAPNVLQNAINGVEVHRWLLHIKDDQKPNVAIQWFIRNWFFERAAPRDIVFTR